MTPIEMAEAMEGRARVRRKITNRENTGDRLSDQLEQAAAMLRQQQERIVEQERTIKGNQIHIMSLESVVHWLKENRPDVWEDIKGWNKL